MAGDKRLVIFPGALGDFLCFRPALLALRAQCSGRLVVVLKESWFDLLDPRDFERLSIDRREIADLFSTAPLKPSTRALLGGFERALSWSGFGNENFRTRLRDVTGGQVEVHPFHAMRDGEHASAYYARTAGVAPVFARYEPTAESRRWAAEFLRSCGLTTSFLAIHPGSGSVAKSWEGMVALSERWRRSGRRVLAIIGPAEQERRTNIACDVELRGEPISRVAAVLEQATFYVGNDSGISHLAAAVGTPGVALFGDSDARTWCPLGESVRVLASRWKCTQCSGRFCVHRLPIERVLANLPQGI